MILYLHYKMDLYPLATWTYLLAVRGFVEISLKRLEGSAEIVVLDAAKLNVKSITCDDISLPVQHGESESEMCVIINTLF